jgi:DNA-binding Lrp family transcriptional regulator
VPAGRPSTLTPQAVETASALAAEGLPLDFIADAIGVHRKTCLRWVREAEEDGADDLKIKFRSAVFAAHRNTATDLLTSIRKSATDGNVWAATWMLTHHPAFRDHFSDAAAERRAVQRTLTSVVVAIDAAGLTDEQRTRLLLTMQAQGIGVQAEVEG